MSSYCVSIGQNEYRVQFSGNQTIVDGQPVQLNLQTLNHDGLHLLFNHRQAVDLHFSSQDRENLEVLVGGRRVMARVETLQRHIRQQVHQNVTGAVKAPMPGSVVEVLVKVGDVVEKGQAILALESMKMQMQIRAPQAGRVTSIAVTAGQQVHKGCELVQLT